MSHFSFDLPVYDDTSISYVPSTRDVQLIQSHFQLITEGISPR